MKYSEYQVWYHTYNTAIESLFLSRSSILSQKLPSEIIEIANKIADNALNKFKQVEDTPQTPNLDLQSLMDRVIKDSKKK